jgi:hypothetical protein
MCDNNEEFDFNKGKGMNIIKLIFVVVFILLWMAFAYMAIKCTTEAVYNMLSAASPIHTQNF